MPTIISTTNLNTIKIPSAKPSEFEVQAFIYSSLRALGVRIRGEVHSVFSENGTRRTKCRFDLVIFDERQNATRIIEVKAHKKYRLCDNGRQPFRYSQFGVPVTFIRGMGEAIAFVRAFSPA